jgi:protein-S-isoprenylcysteine O-methyltransferase Ste14
MTTMMRLVLVVLPLLFVGALWQWRKPTKSGALAACLATLWNLVSLCFLHVGVMKWGGWHFGVLGALLWGIPIDLLFAWGMLWGALPWLAFPHIKLWKVALGLVVLDILTMRLCEPVIVLHKSWWIGEILGLLICFVPSQLLARWTGYQRQLRGRVALQIVLFGGTFLLLLPGIVLHYTGASWQLGALRPFWYTVLIVELMLFPVALGVMGVMEFAERGKGTPIPYDPPKKLVTTGPYAYVANPMQLSHTLLFFGLGWLFHSVWLALGGVVSFAYSAGLARWHEGVELRERFGDDWLVYREHVWSWLPRWRPFVWPDLPAEQRPKLYIRHHCQPCSQVRTWFESKSPQGLDLCVAEHHPTRQLSRMTYEAGDGTRPKEGVEAFACAVGHIHFGWAWFGWFLRLPLLLSFLQMCMDVAGAGPQPVCEWEPPPASSQEPEGGPR